MKVFALLLILLGCASKSIKIEKESPAWLPHATASVSKPSAEAYGKKFMVSADGVASSKAGAKMFALGGNAIDAAVAASFAISVERPHSTGLGGGGFLVLYSAKEKFTYAFDFRERAPLKASRDMYLDAEKNPVPKLSIDGALASGVPGMVAGLLEVHRRFGKLPLSTVVEPAIEVAENGFVVYPDLANALADRKYILEKIPASAKIFLKADGSTYGVGEVLVQKDLAKTLREIAKKGKSGFYEGWVAKAIVGDMKKWGGAITQQDLRKYKVKEREPVRGIFMGHEVVSMPPPSSGGTHVIQLLNLMEEEDFSKGNAHPHYVHRFAQSMQRAYADRAEYLGDTDFVMVPMKGIRSKEYAKTLRAQFGDRASPSTDVKAGEPRRFEGDHTTHLNVMDAEGNTVASTQTINGWMGSGLVVEGTGIVMNNEMDDFAIKPGVANLFGALGGDKNSIAPLKTPLSSMSPTILFKNGSPVLALGSPSGTRIITCVTQVILNRIGFGLPLYDAVSTARYHHQWFPDEIRSDAPGFPSRLASDLEGRGHKLRIQDLGCRIAAIENQAGVLHGVMDPRGDGIAAGE